MKGYEVVSSPHLALDRFSLLAYGAIQSRRMKNLPLKQTQSVNMLCRFHLALNTPTVATAALYVMTSLILMDSGAHDRESSSFKSM